MTDVIWARYCVQRRPLFVEFSSFYPEHVLVERRFSYGNGD
jgi:hypothetical protein